MRRLLPFILLCAVGCTLYVENGTLYFHRRIVPTPEPEVVVPPKPDNNPHVKRDFRCAILHDPAKDKSLTSVQRAIMYGGVVAEWMGSHASSFIIIDGTPDSLASVDGEWKSILDSNPPKSLPWVVMVNGVDKPISKPLHVQREEWTADVNLMAGVQ